MFRRIVDSFVTTAFFWIMTLNMVVAQEQSQQSPSDYAERGIACLRIDDYDGAIANFDKAIILAPNDSVNYFRRGVTFMERGVDRQNKGDLDRAVADLSRAIEIDPLNGAFYFSRGAVKLYQWKDEEAEKDFQKSLEIDSEQKKGMDKAISEIKRKRKAARMQ